MAVLGGRSEPLTFAVTSTGGVPAGPITITIALGGTNGNAFVVSAPGCVGVLLPGGRCNVEVGFAPVALGPAFARLTASAPNLEASVDLVGQASGVVARRPRQSPAEGCALGPQALRGMAMGTPWF